MTKFTPDTDIPSLAGKVIIVTGGNVGLGKETIFRLSKHSPSKIYLAARSKSKAEAAIEEIRTRNPTASPIVFLELNLASFASVKKAADEVLSTTDRIDILMNNAGIMATPPALTEDGYEVQFGTNHMGHALFTKLLLPLLVKTSEQPGSDVRIINLSSLMHEYAPKEGIIYSQLKTDMAATNTNTRYGQSKLANALFTYGLAKRYPNIKSVSIHPGVVQTNLIEGAKASYPRILSPVFSLMSKIFFTKVEDGALNQLWAATAKKDDVKQAGFYYPGRKEIQPAPSVVDPKKADELWDYTEKELAAKGF